MVKDTNNSQLHSTNMLLRSVLTTQQSNIKSCMLKIYQNLQLIIDKTVGFRITAMWVTSIITGI